MKTDIIFSGFNEGKEYRFTLKDEERETSIPTEEDYRFAQNITPISLEFR